MYIAIDIDGTSGQFRDHFLDTYKEYWPDRFMEDKEAYGAWDFITPQTHFATVAQAIDWIYDTVGATEFWATMPAMPGFKGALTDLLAADHRIIFVTNRRPEARMGTELWVRSMLPKFASGTPELAIVPGTKTVIDAQLFVEDNPTRLAELEEAGRKFLRFTTTNAHYNAESPGLEVNNWASVVEIVKGFQHGLKLEDWAVEAGEEE